jgi:two-component system phosphate regulon sensor histidine kinase PhoR
MRVPDSVQPLIRPIAVALVAIALQVALQLPLGWHDDAPGVAAAAGVFLALVAGLVGGPAAGLGTGAVGWTLNFLFVADASLGTLWALPVWLAAGGVAGWIATSVRRATGARAIAESELGALREAAADAVLRLDPDGAIAAWSRGAEAMYGYAGDEIEGRPLADLLGGGDAEERAQRLVDAALREEPVADVEGTHRRRDGSLFPVTASAVSTRGDGGRPSGVILVARDISDVVRSTKQQRELEAKYRSLTEHLPVVTYVCPVEGDGAPISVSPQVDRLLGYTADELVRDAGLFGRLVHPDDRSRVLEQLAEAPERGASRRSEYRLVSRDGRTIWVRDEAATVLDAHGRPLCVQGFLLDVTAERAVGEERGRLRAAEEAATADAHDRQRKVDVVAKAAALLNASLDYRRTTEEVAALLVRDLADWCLVDVRDENGRLRRIVSEQGESRAALTEPAAEPEPEVRHVVDQQRQDVSERRICVPLIAHGRRALGALTLVSEEGGRAYDAQDASWAQAVAGLVALAVERARLYEEVEARADASRVLAYVGDGVFLLDKAETIRLWNPAAEAITGLAADDVLGQAAGDAIPGWQEISHRVPIAAARAPARAETLPLGAERGERWISISGVEFFGGTVYAFRDITELHALDELQAEFLATASHELRTPLAAVYGAAQTLRRHDFALDEAGRQRFISMIVDESDRLGRIVNQILLANQLDVGRMDFVTEPFDAAELVERVVESARTHAPSNIAFDVRVEESVPPVAADKDMVRQILVNLVENAIKYSPEGGRIELGAQAGNGMVLFRVLDEGLGIPPEEQSRIFEKFYRLDPDMTRGIGGTGLGLYICSELVERMGGRIWVESREGKGSAFFFELPGMGSPRVLSRAREDPAVAERE